MLCGLSRKIKVLPSFQRVWMDWFQFKKGIASWRGGREWGWGIPCIKQAVRIWVILNWGLGVLALLGLWGRWRVTGSLTPPCGANPQVRMERGT